MSVSDALAILGKTPGILRAQPNFIYKICSTFPNDPNFKDLWGMARIRAPQAWDVNTRGDVVVAVIDTGVNYNHPDLAANMWVNQGEIPGNGLDDDGNGFVDDVHGYDFVNDNGDPNDDRFHGTHVAGIIGAIGNNGEGVTGVCWNVKIMAVKCLNDEGGGDTFDAIESIRYANAMGVKVMNNSWGGGPDEPELEDAIIEAGAAGVLFIAAAGNDGQNNDQDPLYPASYTCSNIISVMATYQADARAIWTNTKSSHYGATTVDLAAPGTNILSTFPTYETFAMWYYGVSTYYGTLGGTSMATPHVAGAAALISAMNPNLTHLQVKQILLDTVDQLTSLNGLCVSGGRLNVYKAILEAGKHPDFLTKQVTIPQPGVRVLPGEQIKYTISYHNPSAGEPNYVGMLFNASIVDYLPEEVVYVNDGQDSNEPNWPENYYNSYDHSYVWYIGAIEPNDTASLTITVRVNNLAEPAGKITNVCVLKADEIKPVTAVAAIDVNSWNPGVVYVNDDAPGSDTGMSWPNAYRNLHDALERVSNDNGSEIWVAAGNYMPGKYLGDYTATFQLHEGAPIYGGFSGTETSTSYRNLLDPNSRSILSGDLNRNNVPEYPMGDSDYVISATNVSNGLIDGLTVTFGMLADILCNNSNITISRSTITNGYWYGVESTNGANPEIVDCSISGNLDSGIYCNGSTPSISRCTIGPDNYYGISADNSFFRATNCVVRQNSTGLKITNATVAPVIRNNTIVKNTAAGVSRYGGIEPLITNCIVWDNSDDLYQCSATYSCIKNNDAGLWNIHSDPCFVDADSNNFHLKPDSNCIDTGDTGFNDFNETDIDGECRIMFGKNALRVDIGADEYFWPKADFNRDGIVNFFDYAIFTPHWHTQYADVNLAGDIDIEMDDLAAFCADWLWLAPWSDLYETLMSQGGDGMFMQSIPAETTFSESLESACLSQSFDEQLISAELPDIDRLLDWLDDAWLAGEITEAMTEQEYLDFRQSLADSAE